jgi:hypothetical protein
VIYFQQEILYTKALCGNNAAFITFVIDSSLKFKFLLGIFAAFLKEFNRFPIEKPGGLTVAL